MRQIQEKYQHQALMQRFARRRDKRRNYVRVGTFYVKPQPDGVIEMHYYSEDRLCAKIHPDGVVQLFNDHIGACSFAQISRRLSSAYIWSKSDKRSENTVRVFLPVGAHRPYKSHNVPFRSGMRFKDGKLLDMPTTEKRRRVDLAKAKPIRDQIAAWEKLARSYFTMLETWGPTEQEQFKRTLTEYPGLYDEPDVAGVYAILKAGVRWHWRLQSYDCEGKAVFANFKTAFNNWKEVIYKEHGVFEVREVPLDKAA